MSIFVVEYQVHLLVNIVNKSPFLQFELAFITDLMKDIIVYLHVSLGLLEISLIQQTNYMFLIIKSVNYTVI